jgi:hypothetical protein
VWLDEAGNVAKELIALPTKLGRVLGQVERGDLTVQAPQLSRQVGQLERAVNRVVGIIAFAALVMAGALIYGKGQDLFAYLFFGGAGIALIWTVFFTRGTRRRFHP